MTDVTFPLELALELALLHVVEGDHAHFDLRPVTFERRPCLLDHLRCLGWVGVALITRNENIVRRARLNILMQDQHFPLKTTRIPTVCMKVKLSLMEESDKNSAIGTHKGIRAMTHFISV